MNDTLFTTLNEYKESYNIRLENHLKEYVDYDELHFIKIELKNYQSYFEATNIKRIERNLKGDDFTSDQLYEPVNKDVEINNLNLMRLILNFETPSNNYYNVQVCEKLMVSFSKIISFLNQLQDEIIKPTIVTHHLPEKISKLNWAGTDLELSELIKALIQANKLNPELNQNEIFKRFRDFLNVSNFNESDKLKDIRKRSNTLTPFINILEISLNNWIKAKD